MRFRCPACSQLMEFPDELTGRSASCPKCQFKFTLPTPSQPAPPAIVPADQPATSAVTARPAPPSRPAPRAEAPSKPPRTPKKKIPSVVWIGVAVGGALAACLLCTCVGISLNAFSKKPVTIAENKKDDAVEKPPVDVNPPKKLSESGRKERGGIPFNAVGDMQRLEAVKTVQIKGNIRFAFAPNVNETTITWEALRRLKYDEKIGVAGRFTVLLVNKHGWIQQNNRNITLKGDGLDFYQNFNYATVLSNLIPLTEKGFEFDRSDDLEVRGRPCYRIVVKKAGRPDLSMFFEKKSDLLFKTDFTGRFVDENLNFQPNSTFVEFFFSDYHLVDGIRHWKKQEQWRNGQMYSTFDVSEVSFLNHINNAFFLVPGLEREIADAMK